MAFATAALLQSCLSGYLGRDGIAVLSRCDKCPRVFSPTGLRLVSRNLIILLANDLPLLESTTVDAMSR